VRPHALLQNGQTAPDGRPTLALELGHLRMEPLPLYEVLAKAALGAEAFGYELLGA